MALNPNRPRKLPGGILLFVLCLLSVVLLTVWAREPIDGPLHRAKSVAETAVTPLRLVGSVITTPISALGTFFTNVTTDEETVAALRAQNEELESQVIRMEEYRQENERLSQLLGLKDAYNLETVGARVISTSTDSWNRTITINKGSLAGLAVGMPVMSANGLIGQIESVSPYSSVVRLIIDEASGVSAFLQSSRTEGVLSGSVDGVLRLDFIPLTVAVEPGDIVITSGAGGVFPKGIPIGEVATVEPGASGVYHYIIVKPVTRVSAYEEVLVLIGNEAEISPVEQGTAPSGSEGAGNGAEGSSAGDGTDGASSANGGTEAGR
ncbi:MAG: rod shape-determining protein MreC [Coriobacteriales bacterium]|jgi:rod shape-determining protein MreC|nr:rod shape-determining protein MreC [Coriobacteriales bacterium]